MENQSQDPLDYITAQHLDFLYLYLGGQAHRKKEAKAVFREALYLSGTANPDRTKQRQQVREFLLSFDESRLIKPVEIDMSDPAFN